MNQTAKSAMGMLHLLGCAMMARPQVPQTEARNYWKRLISAIAASGSTELDPEVFKTTEPGKLISEAAMARIQLQGIQPDPAKYEPDEYISEYRAWLEQVILLADGAQQRWELEADHA